MPRPKTRRHCVVRAIIEFDVNLLDNETAEDADKFINTKIVEALLFEYDNDIESVNISDIVVSNEEISPIEYEDGERVKTSTIAENEKD